MWGSGFAGALCAIVALATGHLQPWQIGFVTSFVSKLSDTVSSEIGKVILLPFNPPLPQDKALRYPSLPSLPLLPLFTINWTLLVANLI